MDFSVFSKAHTKVHVIVLRATRKSMLLVEEKLVVIIFHCTLKKLKKLKESSLYPKQSTVKGQIVFHIVRLFSIKLFTLKASSPIRHVGINQGALPL